MGWLCPACGNENRFSDTECQVCGKKTSGLYRFREKRAAVREKQLWNRPFQKTEALLFSYNSGFSHAVGRGIHAFSRQIATILLLLMLAGIMGDFLIYSEQTLANFPYLYRIAIVVQEYGNHFQQNSAALEERNTLHFNDNALYSLRTRIHPQDLRTRWQSMSNHAANNVNSLAAVWQEMSERFPANTTRWSFPAAIARIRFFQLQHTLRHLSANAAGNLHAVKERIQTFDLDMALDESSHTGK